MIATNYGYWTIVVAGASFIFGIASLVVIYAIDKDSIILPIASWIISFIFLIIFIGYFA